MYLLDTNVVSALRRPEKADPALRQWADSVPLELFYLSVITILEIEIGAGLIARRDKAQGDILRRWIDDHILPAFEGRILAVDTAIARQCARLHIPDPRPDRDAMIAATALVHGLTVATRNDADFAPMRVPLLNPWHAA
jgi:toxin FitB